MKSVKRIVAYTCCLMVIAIAAVHAEAPAKPIAPAAPAKPAATVTTTTTTTTTPASPAAVKTEPTKADVATNEKSKSILILDGSGSMWQKIGDKTKIEIARSTVDQVLTDWNPNAELGIIAYGHRQKGDCKDIEVLRPVGPVDAKAIHDQLAKLNPVGKTPITDALKKAAEELKYTESKATVILVSDGEETCHADPCAAAAEMKAKGIDFTAHVIGFDTNKEQQQQLQCLAANTGGMYMGAKDADELKKALEAVEKTVTEADAKKEDVKPLPDGKLVARVKLQEGVFNDKKEQDLDRYWTVQQLGENGEPVGVAKTMTQLSANTLTWPEWTVPGGKYRVSLTLKAGHCCGSTFTQETVDVKPSDTTTVDLNAQLTDIYFDGVFAAGDQTKINLPIAVVISHQNDDGSLLEIGKPRKDGPNWIGAGKYVVEGKVTMNGSNLKIKENVEVKGDTAKMTHTLNFNAGSLRVKVNNPNLKQAGYFIEILGEPDISGTRAKLDAFHYPHPPSPDGKVYLLTAGKYRINLQGRDAAKIGKDVTIEAGKIADVALDAPK